MCNDMENILPNARIRASAGSRARFAYPHHLLLWTTPGRSFSNAVLRDYIEKKRSSFAVEEASGITRYGTTIPARHPHSEWMKSADPSSEVQR